MEGHGARLPSASSSASRSRDRAHRSLHRQARRMDRLSLWFDRRILPGAWACACLLGTLCTALPPRVSAEEITGTVTHVASGDTLFVTEGGNEVEVRLADIGAPQRRE